MSSAAPEKIIGAPRTEALGKETAWTGAQELSFGVNAAPENKNSLKGLLRQSPTPSFIRTANTSF